MRGQQSWSQSQENLQPAVPSRAQPTHVGTPQQSQLLPNPDQSLAAKQRIGIGLQPMLAIPARSGRSEAMSLRRLLRQLIAKRNDSIIGYAVARNYQSNISMRAKWPLILPSPPPSYCHYSNRLTCLRCPEQFQAFLQLSHKIKFIMANSIYPAASANNNMKTSTQEWSAQAESELFELHLRYGNKWSIIARRLARPDICIKNKFYSTLRKGFRKMNRYIASVRRITFQSEASANKLLKPQFLNKLIAIADRNFQQKYEVRQKALDLSQTIMQKLVELAQSDIEYPENDERVFPLEEDLLALIQEFSRNVKRRKGKRKSVIKIKGTSIAESSSLEQSVVISVEDYPSDHQIRQDRKEINSKVLLGGQHQGKTESKQQENIPLLLVHEPINSHCYPQDESHPNYYIINDLHFPEDLQNYGQSMKTPTYSLTRSLLHITDPSPCYVPASFKQYFQTALKGIRQTSLHISKNTQSSVLERSRNFRQRSIDFIERIPMMSQSTQNSLFFNSAQFPQVYREDSTTLGKTLSNSEGYQCRTNTPHIKHAQIGIIPNRLQQTKFKKKISTIHQTEYQPERKLENIQRASQ